MSTKKWMLEITRGTGQRAERPTEAVIKDDSEKNRDYDFVGQAQDKLKDNYFMFVGHGLNSELSRIISRMEFNDYKLQLKDGWRVVEYPHSELLTYRTALLSDIGTPPDPSYYEECHIEWEAASTNGTEILTGENAYTDATAWIAANLDESDGYVRWGFTGPNLVPNNRYETLESRPSLWGTTDSEYILQAGLKNQHGRSEDDRL